MEPLHSDTWYFINNILGLCLNQFGMFEDGEKYCRPAFGIDPSRPNGYKNLGIALAGQFRYREAAENFVLATKVNASDARSLVLLQDLLRDHEDLQEEFRVELACCEEAVKVAAAAREG